MGWFKRLTCDLFWVAASAPIALLIRDNFTFSPTRLSELIPYALICVVIATFVFTAARLNRDVWRYTSLLDVLHILAAVTVVLLLGLFVCFFLNRLEGVARSLPVIQWFFVTFGMVGSRGLARMSGERIDRNLHQSDDTRHSTEYVLIVGMSDLTRLYLRAVAAFCSNRLSIEGILAADEALHGMRIHTHRILGSPEDLSKVLAQLELHGVRIDRVVVVEPIQRLSTASQEELLRLERSSAIKVEWLVDNLGLRGRSPTDLSNDLTCSDEETRVVQANQYVLDQGYVPTKRAIDVVGAMCLTVLLAPVAGVIALLVAIDVGLPVVFWQQRPGKRGRRFRLFKFRTMRAAHNGNGDRVPDDGRCSSIGRFLRLSRLDELPQLYNILVGDMSFVGPRPLLPADQCRWERSRLRVHPGLTGWAQVNGGRYISPEDKAVLDLWYIEHASLWLDIKILMKTVVTVLMGERANGNALRRAHEALEKGESDHGNRSHAYAIAQGEKFRSPGACQIEGV